MAQDTKVYVTKDNETNMYNKSTVYHAVMQKSTGRFLPGMGAKRGFTHMEPVAFDMFPPRLHMHAGSARRAMHAWCQGKHVNAYTYDEFGGVDGNYPEVKDGTARDKNDFEVRRIRLVIEEVETNLSDGRPMIMAAEGVKPVYVYDVKPFKGEPDE